MTARTLSPCPVITTEIRFRRLRYNSVRFMLPMLKDPFRYIIKAHVKQEGR